MNDSEIAALQCAIIAEIDSAFDVAPIPQTSELLMTDRDGKDPELEEIKAAIGGKSWLEIPFRDLYNNDALLYLTNKAFYYYLPAYIRAALLHWKTDRYFLEITIYKINPYNDGRIIIWKDECLRGLSMPQKRAVQRFVSFLMTVLSPRQQFAGLDKMKQYWDAMIDNDKGAQ